MTIINRIRVALGLFPITIGSQWTPRDNEGNPWTKWVYVVEDVKGGWVKTRATIPSEGYVARKPYAWRASVFRACHYPIDTSTPNTTHP